MLKQLLSLLILAALLIPAAGHAAQPSAADLNKVFTEVFGGNKSFSTVADIRVTSAKQKIQSLPIQLRWLEGQARLDLDLTQLKADNLPAEQLGALKKAGVEKVAAIFDQRAQNFHVLSPGLNSYATQSVTPSPGEKTEPLKFKKTAVGEEKVGDQRCVKNKFAFAANGEQLEVMTWNAVDLKQFPLKLEMKSADYLMVINFRDLKFAAPEASSFTVPSSYTKQNSLQELMSAVMLKMMTAGTK